jgi:hypothetical protein
MKKLLVVLIGATTIIVGGVFASTHSTKTEMTTKTPAADTKVSYAAVDACDVLTEAVASQILGTTPTKGDTDVSKTSTNNLNDSDCTYFYKPDAGTLYQQLSKMHTVSLLVRAAKNAGGANSNQAQFATLPKGMQWVAGYGAKSYWDPKLAQLNILDNNNWYILNHYEGPDPTTATLDQARQLADALRDNLK